MHGTNVKNIKCSFRGDFVCTRCTVLALLVNVCPNRSFEASRVNTAAFLAPDILHKVTRHGL